MSVASQALALHAEGCSHREVARRLNRSHTQIRRIVSAARPTTGLEAMLAKLEQAGVSCYTIEREGRRFRIINMDLPLGTRKETRSHAALQEAIIEALKMWT